jgi:predicted nucleic-acid-binding Zn-ribbon protein
MKNGQCPKCGSHDVVCNTNRKFPALHTIPLGSGTVGNRYAPLDTYVCVTCGYVESYVAHAEDLRRIKEEWAAVKESGDRVKAVASRDARSGK